MKSIISAAFMLAFASTAYAQSTAPLEPMQPATPSTTPAPAVEVTPPAARCEELTDAPAPPNGATVNMRGMTAGNDAYRAWRLRAEAVLECRRLHYNAAIDRLNTAATAWKTQVDAYCARRDIRCTPVQRGDVQVTPTAPR